MTRTRLAAATAAAVIVAGLLAGCAVPSGGIVVGLGRLRGQIAIAPVTYYYDGTAGERLNVGPLFSHYDVDRITDYTEVIAPGGTVLTPLRKAGMIQQVELPTTARYQIVMHMVPVNPSDLGPKDYVLDLSHDEDRGVAGLGVLPAPNFIGQEVTYTYNGTAGEQLNVAGGTLTDPGGTVHQPGPFAGTIHLTLPATGPYVVTLAALTPGALSHDVTGGPITLGHTTPPPLLTGQRIRYTYSGTTGEALGLEVEASEVNLLAPSGNAVTTCVPDCPRRILPEDGTYTIAVTTPHVGLWLSHDRDDGTIVPGTRSATGLVAGQTVTYSYAGTAGETLRVHPYHNQAGLPPANMLVAPGGSDVPQTPYSDGTRNWSNYVLPVTGTYRLVVTPRHGGSEIITDVWSIP